MSKRQKGRRHRRVNRTPRPVGGSSRPEARLEARLEGRPEGRWGARQEGRTEGRTEGRAEVRVEARREAPVEPRAEAGARVPAGVPAGARIGAPGGARAATGADVPPPARPAAAPGLGRHEARTWDGLRSRGADGASVDDLCAAVGYQPRTILKHVAGLAGHGLAEQRGDRWYARTGEGALAGAQGG
ncbi:hypothetical protein ACQEVS_04520 [Streptomyces sp. CA-181903]|uniref:hypothetical protein n=1 Tax=Streptomyces sp. CA-181903 TaxID=3240055 RepID=UPI003D93FFF8